MHKNQWQAVECRTEGFVIMQGDTVIVGCTDEYGHYGPLTAEQAGRIVCDHNNSRLMQDDYAKAGTVVHGGECEGIDKSTPLAKIVLDLVQERNSLCAQLKQGEAVAYRHTLHMEFGQVNVRLSPYVDPVHAFGKPDENYSSSYQITTEPLYTAKSCEHCDDTGADLDNLATIQAKPTTPEDVALTDVPVLDNKKCAEFSKELKQMLATRRVNAPSDPIMEKLSQYIFEELGYPSDWTGFNFDGARKILNGE